MAGTGALTLGRWAEGARLGQPRDGMALGKLTCSSHTYGKPPRKQNWTLYSRAEGGLRVNRQTGSRKSSFPERTVKHWSRLPRQVVSSLGGFQDPIDPPLRRMGQRPHGILQKFLQNLHLEKDSTANPKPCYDWNDFQRKTQKVRYVLLH